MVALETAYDKDSDNKTIANNYAISLSANKKYDKAEEIYRQLYKDNSSDRDIMLNYAVLLIENLQKYKDDPARSEVIYDFINAARSLYSFNKNYGLDATPLTNAANPFKLSVVSSRVTSFGYMHFKSLSNLVKFNEDLLASIDDEKIQLKGYTKTVL